MTTTTDTTTIELAPGALTLVTVSETFTDWPATAPEDRTFYATTSAYSGAYGTIVVPESDPRSRGMWAFHGDALGLVDHRGWNIPLGSLSPYVDTTARAEDDTTADDTTAETFTREDVDRLVREAREQADREAREALDAFKRTANARAVEYAEQNGLCSEFERCMEDIGLMGREEWHEAHDDTYRVTFLVSLDIRGHDEDHAEDRAREDFSEYLGYGHPFRINHHDTTVL